MSTVFLFFLHTLLRDFIPCTHSRGFTPYKPTFKGCLPLTTRPYFCRSPKIWKKCFHSIAVKAYNASGFHGKSTRFSHEPMLPPPRFQRKRWGSFSVRKMRVSFCETSKSFKAPRPVAPFLSTFLGE